MQRWEWIALATALVAFALIRVPLFTAPGLILGWNSDAALFGLMARAMASGADFPLFFWGQFYLGTLTSMLTALVAFIVPGDAIGPMDLRVAASLEVIVSIALFWFALRRTFSPLVAAIAGVWLVAGPAFLFHFTSAPIGAEQLLLIAAVLFWYSTRVSFDRLAQWFALGAIVGFGMWLHQGVMFMIGAVGLTLLFERRVTIRRLIALLAGAAIGYTPAAIALLRHDPLLYRRTIPGWAVMRFLDRIEETMRSDLWLFLTQPTAIGIAVALALIAFAASGLRGSAWNRGQRIAALTILFSTAFWFFSTYPYPGAVRYIAPALPLIYGAAAGGIVRLGASSRKGTVAAVIAIVAVTLTLFIPRFLDARAIAAGSSEQYTNWPGGFDPRPTLADMRTGGYSVCYGQVWVAHKLEWISEPTVRFAVVDSVHRTLPQSLLLIEKPGPKCFVENYGEVRRLTTEEEAYRKSSVKLRARKAGLLRAEK
jgi:hypothetical protein